MRTILLLAVALSIAGCMPHKNERTCFHDDAAIEKSIGYCQAVRVGDTLYISGVTASGPIGDAVRKVYRNLGGILKAHGLTFADVVKENVYATNLDAFIETREIRKEFYGQTLPAATWVQVQRLYLPAFVVEVELTAQFPDN